MTTKYGLFFKGQSWDFTSSSTATVMLGQVLSIATYGTRTTQK